MVMGDVHGKVEVGGCVERKFGKERRRGRLFVAKKPQPEASRVD